MVRAITASEANQRFSEMLRDVQQGESFIVTSRGRPVAKIGPVDQPNARALDDFLERAKAMPVRIIGSWTRDDLYE